MNRYSCDVVTFPVCLSLVVLYLLLQLGKNVWLRVSAHLSYVITLLIFSQEIEKLVLSTTSAIGGKEIGSSRVGEVIIYTFYFNPIGSNHCLFAGYFHLKNFNNLHHVIIYTPI